MAVEQSLTQSLYKVDLPGMALRLILTVERDHLLRLFSAQTGVHTDTCKPVCTVTR
jgi:hypothetical protein